MLTPLIAVLMARTITLPPGETHLQKPFEFHDAELRGDPAGSTLVMDPDFRGSAAIVVKNGHGITLSGFSVRGNRRELKSDWYLPLQEAAFADYYSDNGIVIRESVHVSVTNVHFSSIRAFPVLVNASSHVRIDSVSISDCGTLNRKGRNNTTGGILFEEGVQDFEAMRSTIARVAGNAIWTHSYSRSPRNARGWIQDNTISFVARDAVQVGHATEVQVVRNRGSSIGYPVEQVDAENYGTPVALDTAGNVDLTNYKQNQFRDVNGECVNLDGFHNGEVSGNSCMNEQALDAYPWSHYAVIFGNHDPGMESTGVVLRGNIMRGFAYGAVFLAGSGNRIGNNEFTRINLAHCGTSPVTARCNYAPDQPDLLRSGIYLSDNGGRPTQTIDNLISGNLISGFGMDKHCIAASPNVDLKKNRFAANRCR